METKTTVERIWKVGGFSGQPTEPVSTGKWISWDQQGSKGVMESRIKRLKDAGIAEIFTPGTPLKTIVDFVNEKVGVPQGA